MFRQPPGSSCYVLSPATYESGEHCSVPNNGTHVDPCCAPAKPGCSTCTLGGADRDGGVRPELGRSSRYMENKAGLTGQTVPGAANPRPLAVPGPGGAGRRAEAEPVGPETRTMLKAHLELINSEDGRPRSAPMRS